MTKVDQVTFQITHDDQRQAHSAMKPWIFLRNRIEGTRLEAITVVQVSKRGGRKCDYMAYGTIYTYQCHSPGFDIVL